MNRKEVRSSEFAMKREWAERFTSEKLRQMLADDEVHGGEATAAREVLRRRGENVSNDPLRTLASGCARARDTRNRADDRQQEA